MNVNRMLKQIYKYVKRGQSPEGSYKIPSRCGCERKSDRGNGLKVIDDHKVYIGGTAIA